MKIKCLLSNSVVPSFYYPIWWYLFYLLLSPRFLCFRRSRSKPLYFRSNVCSSVIWFWALDILLFIFLGLMEIYVIICFIINLLKSLGMRRLLLKHVKVYNWLQQKESSIDPTSVNHFEEERKRFYESLRLRHHYLLHSVNYIASKQSFNNDPAVFSENSFRQLVR